MNHKKKIYTENLSPLPGTTNQCHSQQLCSLFIKIERTTMKLLDKVISLHQSVFSFIKPSFTLSAFSMLLNINGNKVNCWVEKGLTQKWKESPCWNLSFLTSHNLFLLSDMYWQVANLTLIFTTNSNYFHLGSCWILTLWPLSSFRNKLLRERWLHFLSGRSFA